MITMAQYDIFKTSRPEDFYVCEIQSEIHSDLTTVVTIPLFPESSGARISKLNPIIRINDKNYYLKTQEMTVFYRAHLGKKIGNIDEYHYDISNAIDFLFHGF